MSKKMGMFIFVVTVIPAMVGSIYLFNTGYIFYSMFCFIVGCIMFSFSISESKGVFCE